MNKYKQLTKEKRLQIEVLLKKMIPATEIANLIGFHKSTIYREIKRHGGIRGGYNANEAQSLAQLSKTRYKLHRKFNGEMRSIIDEKLQEKWSPEQISNYCKLNGINMVSHERIYQYVYEDKQSGGDLYKHLRTSSKPYRKKYGKYDRRGKIPGRVSIEERPEAVNQRKRFGDWEMDTIIGKNKKEAVLTIVERKSRFTVIAKLERKSAGITRKKCINALAQYKDAVKTITSDNGSEFYQHAETAKKLDADYYFTHPYSAWEKGLNENTNGLIRQYIPKKTDLNMVSTQQLLMIANQLNDRPRKCLKWKSPIQVFMSSFENQSVALGT